MTRHLLWRGMLAGLIGAFVAATFALLFAEPRIDAAIALEAAHAMPGMAEPELVSRATQKGFGLYTAMMLYGTALGGLLAILFAALHGRVGRTSPRGLALMLGLVAFLVIVLVPAIKYPPTPPAVGLHETVRMRTGAFFAMLTLSVAAATAAFMAYRRIATQQPLDRLLIAIGLYIAVVALLQLLLPKIDEVPADFPATLLWQFRLASIGTQGVFWLVTADLFGRLVEPRLSATTLRSWQVAS
ncbi:CbtA family protein [Sphingomonas prati]|uniref:Putative cobalt transporter CbtA n=1 Tax=Sphingomonas prati TaxID=1843237 RepID=A0A7W9F2P7_9SPHN|nr:CbtA family protein [Sphingomonas prati]MBB5728705.1 putative cobalt transporter CbtA [Sphingomonas prati]GGE71745.1 membrane protein [Sphingomonas prati]